MKWIALILALAGLGAAVHGFSRWRECGSYTVHAEGVVSQRTPTFVAVRVGGDIPGGQGTALLSIFSRRARSVV